MKKRKFFSDDVYYGFARAYMDLYRLDEKTLGLNDGVLICDVAEIWRLSSEIIQEGKSISLVRQQGRIVVCELGKRFLRALKKVNAIMGRCKSAWEFDPYVDIFLQEVVLSGLASKWSIYGCDERLFLLLSECVDNIRVRGRSLEFKRKINDFKRAPNKNFKSLSGYFERIFSKCDELLVIRLNLFYSKGPGELGVGREYGKVARDRDKFLGGDLSGYASKLYGYSWKVEGDSVRGCQLHMVLFFSGGIPATVSLGVILGCYWEGTIAAGEGQFFCFNGIGGSVVSYKELAGRAEVQKIAAHMTLIDAYARAILPKGARRLGKGRA